MGRGIVHEVPWMAFATFVIRSASFNVGPADVCSGARPSHFFAGLPLA